MPIEHLTIWCKDLAVMKDFYVTYVEGVSNNKYHNLNKQFSSYFLSFDKGPRLELMLMPGVPDSLNDAMAQFTGLIYFSVAVGSEEKVNTLTESFRASGITIVGEPRTTGDGYYESVVLDPEGNRIEISM